MSNLVSVIMPVYNGSKYIQQAIQSVLAQTYQHWELIVVDDGSTDDTPAIASQFRDLIVYIRQENQGQAAARNTGIRAARGEYIALLDSDDEWLPCFLEKMIIEAQLRPDASVYYCHAHYIDSQGLALPEKAGARIVPPEAMCEVVLTGNFLLPSTMLLRRFSIVAAGLFDQSSRLRGCEDWDLWLRMARFYTFIGIPESMVNYRLHSNSTSAHSDHMQKAMLAVIEKHFGPDDGDVGHWPKDKCQGYGGAYRTNAITSVMRQNDWVRCGEFTRQALTIDPSTATDLGFFYELALGPQPPGYRGTPYQLDLTQSALGIHQVLEEVFRNSLELLPLRSYVYGTAYYALGLVAYNTGQTVLSRRFLVNALLSHHPLAWTTNILATLARSSVSGNVRNVFQGVRIGRYMERIQ